MRGVALVGVVVIGLQASGCYLLETPEVRFVSNRELLDGFGRALGYDVDPSRFDLVGVDCREDSVTLRYRGVEHVGDTAWVLRFSVKSSEQDPQAVADIYALLPLLAEGRPDFELVEEGERTWNGVPLEFARYRFDSPVRDNQAEPFPAHGIVVSIVAERDDGSIVYHVKLDNHGDREDVGLDDLEPLLTGILRRGP